MELLKESLKEYLEKSFQQSQEKFFMEKTRKNAGKVFKEDSLNKLQEKPLTDLLEGLNKI